PARREPDRGRDRLHGGQARRARPRPRRRLPLRGAARRDALRDGAARARHGPARRRHRRPLHSQDLLLDPRTPRHRRLGRRHGRVHRPLAEQGLSNLAIGFWGVIALLVILWLRVPIAVALAIVGVAGYAAIDGWRKALTVLASVPFELASAYSLSVVPLFILMGAVASRGRMAKETFDACNGLFSGVRGALANATIGACALF